MGTNTESILQTILSNCDVWRRPFSPILVRHTMSNFPMLVIPLNNLTFNWLSGLGVKQNKYCLLSSGFKQLTSPKTGWTLKVTMKRIEVYF